MNTEAFIVSMKNLTEDERRVLAERLEAMTAGTAPAGQPAQPAVLGYPPRRA